MENLLVTAGRKDSPLHLTDVNYAEVKYAIVKQEKAELGTGDPEFKALEKELKIHWMK